MSRFHPFLWSTRAAVALVIAVTASPFANAQEVKAKKYALVVGVKDYDHREKLAELKYTENDAAEMASVLRAAGYEVVLLTSTDGKKDAKAKPTLANINKQLDELLNRCNKEDTVLVALAGHGMQFDREDSFFCPEDAVPLADAKSRETLLSLKEVYKRLNGSKGAVKLLLVDACRNDPSSSRSVDGEGAGRPPKNVAALFSCSAGERAFEHDNYRHGIFFYHVLEGLRGKAKNGDDEVTWDTLQAYVRKKVSADTPQLLDGVKQTPSLNAGELSGAPPVLIGRNVKLVRQPSLATMIIALDRATAERLQIPQRSQPQVAFVVPGGGGDAMGLRRGDVIRRINGRDVETAWLAQAALKELKTLGERVELDITRDKTPLKFVGRMETPFSEEEIVRRVKELAVKNDPVAAHYLGTLYEEGRGVARNTTEAANWYRKAADAGVPEAQCYLGLCYEFGVGVTKSDTEAAKWYGKAADRGCSVAQDYYGTMCFMGRGVSQDDGEAVKWYRKAAEQGLPTGQFNLAWMYEFGRGTANDDAEAVKWYRKAADQGHSGSHNKLGSMYYYGKGVGKDWAESVRRYRIAAEKEHVDGMFNLGWMYEKGEGVKQDEAEGAKWYRKAADEGHLNAQTNLGILYAYGRGVAKSDAEAVKWYRKAAEKGYADAQKHLGYMTLEGRGVVKNEAEAYRWYRKAADQGDAYSLNQLGNLTYYGQGVAKNEKEAVNWYRQAADKGHADGQYNLGWMYENGAGVTTNVAEAVKWYRKAAAQGHEGALKDLKRLNVRP